MVDTFLSQLNSAGFTTTNVGAGVGTWINNAQGYIQTLAAKSRLNFIDLHVYPINLTFLNDTITLIDLAQSAGKPVTMCEAWLQKRRDTEFTGVRRSQQRHHIRPRPLQLLGAARPAVPDGLRQARLVEAVESVLAVLVGIFPRVPQLQLGLRLHRARTRS